MRTKVSDGVKAMVFKEMAQQKAMEETRLWTLNSVGDRKWRKLEEQERRDEEEMTVLLKRYNAVNPT
jgi:hypothetical protein